MEAAGSGFNLANLWPIALIFAVFYFMFVRPNKKRQEQQRQMMASITEGTEVMTTSGIFGIITSVLESAYTLEIAEDVEVIIQKAAIINVLPNGTIEAMRNPDEVTELESLPPPPPPSCCA